MPFAQLEKAYDPGQVEERWYRFWTDKGYFHASVDHPGTPYCIVIPPPNITGSLHVGHALNNSLQDILIRWRRMQGRNALWVPGTDHAGIATQNVVERHLMDTEGLSREDLGREKFIQRVQEWRNQYGGSIIQQLKRLGASCDWSRLRFTLDEGLSKAVREVFVRLYEDGLIYRGERLINWCPHCLTALSDIEVEREETKGKLYYIGYPLSDDHAVRLTVATTRPETMLADTAVAVHPEDPRYNRLIGGAARLPLTSRTIPIVGDSILVDREFGTGAVKITPAHDFNDFEAGNRHGLARLSIFTEDAKLDPGGLREAQVEESLQRQIALKTTREARKLVVEALDKGGFLKKVEDHPMALGRCYRCKTVVEPYLSPQWFVKIKPLAEPAIKAVETGRVRLIPESWVNNYLGWMRDIKDWCISRQIWWGHQIPAWYCRSCNEDAILETAHGVGATAEGGTLPAASKKSFTITSAAKPIVARTKPAHCPGCSAGDFVRDPDVLDTWFSSALWPFSTLGWPEQTPELKQFYPTSALVTSFDILFFWVARMIMMGLKFMGDVPFRDVYIHALVRDAEGQKMSKSKGNVIDPLSVMERYGTDALRFTLAAMASPGRDIKLSEERIEGYRNFANKLWNAARFILEHVFEEGGAGREKNRRTVPPGRRGETDRWLMSRLADCIGKVQHSLEAYRFDEAAHHLYHFTWHEYCDWYLELSKPVLRGSEDRAEEAAIVRGTLVETFEILLRLLHPFMPFITEEIWQKLPREGTSVMLAPFPTARPDWSDKEAEEGIQSLIGVVSEIRAIRAKYGIPPSRALAAQVSPHGDRKAEIVRRNQERIETLARLGARNLALLPSGGQPDRRKGLAVGYTEGATVYVLLEGIIDLRKERERLTKRIRELEGLIERETKKLANPDFVNSVSAEVLEKSRAKEAELSAERSKLSQELSYLAAE